MFLGIDRLIIAAQDCERVATKLRSTLGLEHGRPGAPPPEGGLAWRSVQLEGARVTLMAVEDRLEAASTWLGRAILAALAGSSDGAFVGFALASDDLAGDAGQRGWLPGAASERLPGGEGLWPLAFGVQASPGAPAIGDAHDGDLQVVRLEVEVEAVRAVQDRWLRAFDLRFRPSLAGGGARDADVGRQVVRLVPARLSAVVPPRATVVLAGPSRSAEVELAGCRVRLERRSG
jgi:hypothetical protein